MVSFRNVPYLHWFLYLVTFLGWASDASGSEEEKEGRSSEVLATLGGQAITSYDVDVQLGREPAVKNLPRLSHAVLQKTVQLIAWQRQALQTLRRMDVAADSDEVDRWIKAHSDEIGDIENRQDALAEMVAFRLSWRRYLATHLNEANLKRHFNNQSERFDGTRFKLLIASQAVPAGTSERRAEAARAMTQAFRLSDGSTDVSEFQRVARENSWALVEPGWVRGSGQLEPELIGGVLGREAPGIAGPVHSAGGVHMLFLSAKEAGQLALAEVRDEVRAHMLLFLLEHLAKQSAQQLPLQAGASSSDVPR